MQHLQAEWRRSELGIFSIPLFGDLLGCQLPTSSSSSSLRLVLRDPGCWGCSCSTSSQPIKCIHSELEQGMPRGRSHLGFFLAEAGSLQPGCRSYAQWQQGLRGMSSLFPDPASLRFLWVL